MPSLTCDNVVKIFGQRKAVRAVDGLSLSVNEGEIFGLLGPNGSGKTTFVKCCLNIIFPTSGRISVLGHHPGHPRAQSRIGYLPENPNFYDHLTGREFLVYHSELARVPYRERAKRVDELIDFVRLEKKASRRKLRTYSKGMVQRIGLAQALMNKPKLLFLDEPQTGLDPIGRRQVKDIMRQVATEGSTVFFSSHVLADVEDVADRVAIIDQGKLRRIATVDELTHATDRVTIRLAPGDSHPDVSKISSETAERIHRLAVDAGAADVSLSDGMLKASIRSESVTPELVSVLCHNGYKVYGVQFESLSLEDSFLKEFGEYNNNSMEMKT